ncbi:DMT family transporter [Aquabacterium sp. A08]|uniref:DMT family transporter n=1 Tax=Aquabacterium sp. A08 TaxID=2718532 RepID=UPI00141D8E13|nr:DMT family transporter [Aquabacterium sp. A08]NIC40804.1 DMT family transporter [Aquabacterium sp. A08]NIC41850.1 DMT family transporter [Aquabacterium sp. A08]
MTLRHGRAVGLMVLVTFLWATAGVVTRQLEQAQAFEITFWRSFFTLLSLLVILPLWQGWGVWRRMRQEGWVLWASGACWAVMFTAFMLGLALTSVANVLITLAAGPLFTALVSRLLFRQRLTPRTWGAIAVAGLGIGWMFGQQLDGGHWLGTLVALGAPIGGAVNWNLVQRSQAAGHQVDLVPAVLIGALLSSLFALPLAWPLGASVHDVTLLAGLGLGQLAIPCVLAVLCARSLSPPEMSLLALLEVLFGIALAWLGANEVPQPYVLQGGALVLGALVANEWLGWREREGHYRIQTLVTEHTGDPHELEHPGGRR